MLESLHNVGDIGKELETVESLKLLDTRRNIDLGPLWYCESNSGDEIFGEVFGESVEERRVEEDI